MQWWETDKYTVDTAIPAEFEKVAGPKGVAVVKANADGSTTRGWGMTKDGRGWSFMDNYLALKFNDQIAKVGWLSGRWDFAFVMRSMKLICIDIDGKNGGLEHIGKLGMLPHTLAETSKSGNGYHLFYSTPSDTWDEDKGFALFKDRIGVVQGVDIRAVGCVYHFSGQLWNDRKIAELPDYQHNTWLARAKKTEKEVDEIIELLDAGDEDALLVAQTGLVTDLAKPIPAGRRNITLFAIGNQMKLAQVPSWDAHIIARAKQVGLDNDEVSKLVSNIKKYGD